MGIIRASLPTLYQKLCEKIDMFSESDALQPANKSY